MILIDGDSKRGPQDLVGSTDCNKRVVIPNCELIDMTNPHGEKRLPEPGDYIKVRIESSTSASMRGTPLYITNIVLDAANLEPSNTAASTSKEGMKINASD